jgi:O-antigen/teichoic acid export membrane protein
VAGITNHLKIIATDSAWAFGLKILGVPFVYLTNLIMARIYGAEIMGTYYLAFSLITSAGAICCLGLHTGLLRFVASNKSGENVAAIRSNFWSAIGLVTALSGVTAIIFYFARIWLGSFLNSPQLPAILDLMVLALPIYVAMIILRETVRGLGAIKRVVFQENLLLPLGFLILISIPAYFKMFQITPVTQLPMAFFLICLLSMIFLAHTTELRKVLFSPFVKSSRTPGGSFQELMRYSLPLLLISVLMLSLRGLDSLILAYFTSTADVAYYNAAIKTTPLVILPLIAVNAVVPPLFAKFHLQGNLKDLEIVAQTTARWMYFLALPMTLLLILLGPELLGFLGPDFVKARFALGALALGQLVNVASGSVDFLLTMTGYQWKAFISQGIIGISILPLMMVLTAFHGLNGLACAAALDMAGLNILMAWYVWRCLRIKSYARKVGRINLGGLVASAVFMLSKPYVGAVLATIFFGLSYLILLAKPAFLEFKAIRNEAEWLEAMKLPQ